MLLAALICLTCCGCPGTKPAVSTNATALPFKGQEVELFVPKSLGLPAAWEVMLDEWSAQTGATIRWTEFSSEEEAALGEKLQPTSSSGGRVLLFPLARLCDVDIHLTPLRLASGADLDSQDIFKGLRERVVSRDRTPVVVPLAAPVLVCYFRRDLLRAAKLGPPETWEDYQSLIDALDRWAPGLTAVEPLGPEHRAATFFARSLAFTKHPENYSVWFDLETAEPLLASPGFEEALTIAQRAWQRMPRSITELTPIDCRHEVVKGRAALALGYEPFASGDASPRIDRASGIEIGVCRLPGSRRIYNPNSRRWEPAAVGTVHAPGLCATTGFAAGVSLPLNGSADVAAWNLLATLLSAQVDSDWPSILKTVCRESQVSTAPDWHEHGLTAEEASQYVDAVAQTLRDTQLVAELPLPRAEELREATSRCVLSVVSDDKVDTAFTDLAAAFAEYVNRVGKDSVRAAHRRGLGLSGPTAFGRLTDP